MKPLTTEWSYQISINSKNLCSYGLYQYSCIPLSEAINRAKRSYWDNGPYPIREPNWNDPDEIDFYVSKVQRTQTETYVETEMIYSRWDQKSLEEVVLEAS